MGRDQPAVAAGVTHHNLGVTVSPEAGVGQLRDAIRRVLDDPAARGAARRMTGAIEPADRVIDEIEALGRVGVPAAGRQG